MKRVRMAELSRDEVCAGVERWFAKYKGTVGIDGDTARVYHGVCRDEDSLDEVYATWAGDPVDPLTRERVQNGWATLVGMAQEMREQ